jgi:cob(I)alamin adenosyltransferase
MAIYTRTGDDGTTALYGGKRLSKAGVQIDAYGTVDELTSTLGVLINSVSHTPEVPTLLDIQRDLYTVMGFLANAPIDVRPLEKRTLLFEKKIDVLTKGLPPLTDFILPNGSLSSCWAHMARVICRKAERSIVLFFQETKNLEKNEPQIVMKYMNRLSDLLFTFARSFNANEEIISKTK